MDVLSVRPIFVVGSPRSGTTLVGSWLGSDPRTYDVGEYNAFYATYRSIPSQLRGVQPPWWESHLDRYLVELREHAAHFIEDVARREGCDSFVDSSPRNLLIADELAMRFPNALFVLMLRHYAGVVQSLGRAGWPWVPSGVEGRADVWANAYCEIDRLPRERTLVISYDSLCASPRAALARMRSQLADAGIRVDQLDQTRLGYSHAHVLGQPRPTLLGDTGELRSIPSVDMSSWTPAIDAAVRPHVALVDDQLRREYAEYVEPAGWTTPSSPEPSPSVAARESASSFSSSVSLVSAEYVVDDLERAEELFVGLMGLTVVQRSRHAEFDADLVLLNAGSVTLSLLCPTDVGDRPPFPAVEPKLAHLTFVVDDERDFVALRSRLVDAGAAVVHSGPQMFHLPEGLVQSILGDAPVIVVVQLNERHVDDPT